MRVICVDDEQLIVEDTAAFCQTLPRITEVLGFTSPLDALEWLKSDHADLAVLDVNMPDMDGITLAREIRKMRPDMPVIFLTAFPEHALDAFAVHATGYLLKPVNREKLAAEVAYALSGKQGGAHITARTFGNFDLFVDGDPVTFRQAKCKELLAYLIDRQGSSVTRAEAFAILWEDRMYDRPMQKQLDVIIRSLRETLEEYHIGWIFELKRGTLRVIPDRQRVSGRVYEHLFLGQYAGSISGSHVGKQEIKRPWTKNNWTFVGQNVYNMISPGKTRFKTDDQRRNP